MKTTETKQQEIKNFYHEDFVDILLKESKIDLIYRIMKQDENERRKRMKETISDQCEIIIQDNEEELNRIKISGNASEYLEYNRNHPFEIAEKMKSLYNYEGIKTTIIFTDDMLTDY